VDEASSRLLGVARVLATTLRGHDAEIIRAIPERCQSSGKSLMSALRRSHALGPCARCDRPQQRPYIPATQRRRGQCSSESMNSRHELSVRGDHRLPTGRRAVRWSAKLRRGGTEYISQVACPRCAWWREVLSPGAAYGVSACFRARKARTPTGVGRDCRFIADWAGVRGFRFRSGRTLKRSSTSGRNTVRERSVLASGSRDCLARGGLP